MSNALSARIGPYLHDQAFKAEKKFEFDRTFTVISAGAYNVGGLMRLTGS